MYVIAYLLKYDLYLKNMILVFAFVFALFGRVVASSPVDPEQYCEESFRESVRIIVNERCGVLSFQETLQEWSKKDVSQYREFLSFLGLESDKDFPSCGFGDISKILRGALEQRNLGQYVGNTLEIRVAVLLENFFLDRVSKTFDVLDFYRNKKEDLKKNSKDNSFFVRKNFDELSRVKAVKCLLPCDDEKQKTAAMKLQDLLVSNRGQPIGIVIGRGTEQGINLSAITDTVLSQIKIWAYVDPSVDPFDQSEKAWQDPSKPEAIVGKWPLPFAMANLFDVVVFDFGTLCYLDGTRETLNSEESSV